MNKAGFFDVLRWWALGGYTMDGVYETGDQFKIAAGQSSFARCFFDEAMRTNNLTYAFNTTTTSVQDQTNRVVVNSNWSAKRVICTVPLNVLHKVRFEPTLSPNKMAVANINQGAKFHLEVAGPALRSWSGAAWPVKRLCHGSGDGLTADGNTHLVFFGSNKDFSSPELDGHDFVADCKDLHDMDVKKTVSSPLRRILYQETDNLIRYGTIGAKIPLQKVHGVCSPRTPASSTSRRFSSELATSFSQTRTGQWVGGGLLMVQSNEAHWLLTMSLWIFVRQRLNPRSDGCHCH